MTMPMMMIGAIPSSTRASPVIAWAALVTSWCNGTLHMAVSRRRILALWFPRLPADRLIRKNGGAPFEAPLVVSGKIGNALHVHALETRAARLGLYKGQPLANARAMVQPLKIVPADERADAAL